MLNFKSDGAFIAVTASNAGLSPCAGTASFPSLNAFWVKTQSCDHFKINSISVLIIKKFKLKKKSLKFFSGIIIFIFSNSASSSSFNSPTNFVL